MLITIFPLVSMPVLEDTIAGGFVHSISITLASDMIVNYNQSYRV